jgi:hypothetical protein
MKPKAKEDPHNKKKNHEPMGKGHKDNIYKKGDKQPQLEFKKIAKQREDRTKDVDENPLAGLVRVAKGLKPIEDFTSVEANMSLQFKEWLTKNK